MLEQRGSQPLYQQLAHALLNQITSGQIVPGQELPSSRELEKIYGVSSITVRRALATLKQQGYLYTVPRRGAYAVAAPAPEPVGALRSFTVTMNRRGVQASSIVLSSAVVPADPHVAERLAVPPGDAVARLERLRLADGIPICVQITHLVHVLCPGILDHDFACESLYGVLEREYGLTIGPPILRIRAALAGPREADLLGVESGAPILHVESRNVLASGQFFEYVTSEYRADRYELSIGEYIQ